MFYIQFFKRNPFLKRKKQKKNFRCVKNAFFGQNLPKKWFFCTFLHILCTFPHYFSRVQCCPSSGPWETGIWHDFWHSWVQKWPKNVQKRPKTSKMTKNGQKTVKNAIYFYFFFLLVFSLLCRHFISCSINGQKLPKMVKNGQKQPKTAFLTVFRSVKNLPPPRGK